MKMFYSLLLIPLFLLVSACAPENTGGKEGVDQGPYFDYGGTYNAVVEEAFSDSDGASDATTFDFPNLIIVQDGPALTLAGILFKTDDVGMSADYAFTQATFFGPLDQTFEGGTVDDPLVVSLTITGSYPDLNPAYSFTYDYVISLGERL